MTLNAESLKALLDALIALDEAYLRSAARQGLKVPFLYKSGVRYGRVGWGQPDPWDAIPNLYVKGWGDCKSLSAAFISQARAAGYDCEPTFRYAIRSILPAVDPTPADYANLAAWERRADHALRVYGVNSKEYRRIAKQNDGGFDYHILVLTDGSMPAAFYGDTGQRLWVDPSKALGMGKNENG
jgi:hypothetical protein